MNFCFGLAEGVSCYLPIALNGLVTIKLFLYVTISSVLELVVYVRSKNICPGSSSFAPYAISNEICMN